MNFNELIFDVDGTLWDSTEVLVQGWNDAVNLATGQPGTLVADDLKRVFGKPQPEMIDILFPELTTAQKQHILDISTDLEHKYLRENSGDFYPQVFSTLTQLARQHRLFIVSNCQAGYIELMLEHGKFGQLIEGHLCYGDNGLSKGENLRLLTERYQLTAPLYIGDTMGDYEACQVAGMPMIFAAYGFGKVPNPDYTIEHFADLVSLTESLND